MNRVTLIGRLGRDPELRQTTSGKAMCSLNLATSWKPKDGEEQTEWHRVVVWGRSAENSDKYLRKGSQVAIEGRLQTREWEKDGQRRWTTEVVAERVEFLGSKGVRQGGGGSGARSNAAPQPSRNAPAEDFDDDEIPFNYRDDTRRFQGVA